MASKTAQASAAWSSASTWAEGSVPAAGDTVDLVSYTVTMDVDAIECASITNSAGGSLPVSLAASAKTITANLNAATAKLVTLTGSFALNVVGNIQGGTSATAYGIFPSNPCHINVTGNVTGGTNASANGIYASAMNMSGVTVTNGNVTAGTAIAIYMTASAVTVTNGDVIGSSLQSNSYGIGAASITVTNGNLIYNTAPPVGGYLHYNPSAVNYIQVGDVKFPQQLAADKILHGTIHGDRTGTLAASNIGDATGTTNLSPSILKSGETVDDITGTLAASITANGGRIGLGL